MKFRYYEANKVKTIPIPQSQYLKGMRLIATRNQRKEVERGTK